MVFSFDDRGLGASTAGAIVAAGGAAAGPIVATSLAVPVVGPIIAGVALIVGMWLNRRGPQQKVATTAIVNEAEPLLQQNLDAWNKEEHTSINQQQALANFDNVWALVVQKCSDPSFGNPGQNCINDRKRGSTKGYDWFALYRDPIATAQIHNTASSVGESFLAGDFGPLNNLVSGIDMKSLAIPLVAVVGLWWLSNEI